MHDADVCTYMTNTNDKTTRTGNLHNADVCTYMTNTNDKTTCTGNLHDADVCTYMTNTHDKRPIRVRHPCVWGAKDGAPTALSDQRTRGTVQYYSRLLRLGQNPGPKHQDGSLISSVNISRVQSMYHRAIHFGTKAKWVQLPSFHM
jgi:hypothetical protein